MKNRDGLISSLIRKIAIQTLANLKPFHSRKRTPLKVCVFKLDRIGDFVLAVSAIRLITTKFGEANCAIIVSKYAAELAEVEFPKATIIEWSFDAGGIKNSLISFLKDSPKLSNFEFEILISLRHQRTCLHNLSLSWINAKESWALENADFGVSNPNERFYQFPFTNIVPRLKRSLPQSCSELESHQSLLSEFLGKKVPPKSIVPHLNSASTKNGDYMAVTPFASQSIRDYPTSQIIAALHEFQKTTDLPIVLSGGPAEQQRLIHLLDIAKSENLREITIKRTENLRDFIKLLANARVVLTMDTSSAHIATALDKPTVVILGGGHHGVFGPWNRSEKQVWLTNPLPCFGCDWNCPFPKALCITEISPIAVSRALSQVIT